MEIRRNSDESDFQNEYETPRHVIINSKNLSLRTANSKARLVVWRFSLEFANYEIGKINSSLKTKSVIAKDVKLV